MNLIFKLADVLAHAYPNIARALRGLEFHEHQLCVSLAAREEQIRRQLEALDVAWGRERRVRKVLDDERDERRANEAETTRALDAYRVLLGDEPQKAAELAALRAFKSEVIRRGLANDAGLFPKARAARPTSCGAMDDEVRAFATRRPSSTRFNTERYDTGCCPNLQIRVS